MTGVQTCALPICFPVTIQKQVVESKLETLGDRPKKPKVKKKVPEVKPKSKKEILEEMRRRGKAALDKKNKGKR